MATDFQDEKFKREVDRQRTLAAPPMDRPWQPDGRTTRLPDMTVTAQRPQIPGDRPWIGDDRTRRLPDVTVTAQRPPARLPDMTVTAQRQPALAQPLPGDDPFRPDGRESQALAQRRQDLGPYFPSTRDTLPPRPASETAAFDARQQPALSAAPPAPVSVSPPLSRGIVPPLGDVPAFPSGQQPASPTPSVRRSNTGIEGLDRYIDASMSGFRNFRAEDAMNPGNLLALGPAGTGLSTVVGRGAGAVNLASNVAGAALRAGQIDATVGSREPPPSLAQAREKAMADALAKPEAAGKEGGSDNSGQQPAAESEGRRGAGSDPAPNTATFGETTYTFNPETGGFDRDGAAPRLTAGDMAARARILSQTPELGEGPTNLGQLPRAAARGSSGGRVYGFGQTGKSWQDIGEERAAMAARRSEQSTLQSAFQDAARKGNTRLAQAIATRLGQMEQADVTARGQDTQLAAARAQAEATGLGRMPQGASPDKLAEAMKTQYELQRKQRIDELVNIAQTKAGTPEGEAASRLLQAFQQQDNPPTQQRFVKFGEGSAYDTVNNSFITPEMATGWEVVDEKTGRVWIRLPNGQMIEKAPAAPEPPGIFRSIGQAVFGVE